MYRPMVEQYGDNEGIVDGDYRSTWRRHDERVSRLTHALAERLGVGPADRFAVLALNSHAYLELWHGAFMGAGVINPLNLRLAPKELAYIVVDSGSEVMFTDASFAPLVAAARREMGGDDPIRHVVLIGEGDVAHDVRYEELLAQAEPTMCAEPEESDPVVLMYTGGTTGLPKGVLIEHRAEMLNVYHGAMTIPGFRSETYLLQTPMFHAASMTGILVSGIYGGKVAFVPLFDPESVLAICEAEQVTDTLMVPTMLGLCFASPGYRPERLASLQRLVYGASPMPEAILTRLQKELPDVQLIQGYGMTESCSTVTLLLSEDHAPGSQRLR
jgi:acyl-CoA synthetase (AMP-forming)/AMP-acid ligase II